MNRTPTQNKAIQWYCERNDLVPQLSTHPVYYFRHRETGKESHMLLEHIVQEYQREKKEESKAKKRKQNEKSDYKFNWGAKK